jgi:hypothetical protein
MPMSILSEAGCSVLGEVVGALERAGLRYWLGRGVFRHWTLKHEFGDQQHDVDFHVLRREELQVRNLVDDLCRAGFEKVPWNDRGYKIPLIHVKDRVPVELIFLDDDGEDLWFLAGGNGQKRYTCPVAVFGDRRARICNIEVRVPSDDYLPAVYTAGWRDESQKNGGVLLV